MTQLDPLTKLDAVLGIICNNAFGISYDQIIISLNLMQDNFYYKTFLADLHLILNKLKEDEFIIEKNLEVKHIATKEHLRWETNYYATYNGKMFHLNEGYTGEYIANEKSKRRTEKRDYMLTVGTWVAGIAGLILAGVEIWKIFYKIC